MKSVKNTLVLIPLFSVFVCCGMENSGLPHHKSRRQESSPPVPRLRIEQLQPTNPHEILATYLGKESLQGASAYPEGIDPYLTKLHMLLLKEGISNHLPRLRSELLNPQENPYAYELSPDYLGKALVHAASGHPEFIVPLLQHPHSHEIPLNLLKEALIKAAAEYADPEITALLLNPRINPHAHDIPVADVLRMTFRDGNYANPEIAVLLLNHPQADGVSLELLGQVFRYAVENGHTEVAESTRKVATMIRQVDSFLRL